MCPGRARAHRQRADPGARRQGWEADTGGRELGVRLTAAARRSSAVERTRTRRVPEHSSSTEDLVGEVTSTEGETPRSERDVLESLRSIPDQNPPRSNDVPVGEDERQQARRYARELSEERADTTLDAHALTKESRIERGQRWTTTRDRDCSRASSLRPLEKGRSGPRCTDEKRGKGDGAARRLVRTPPHPGDGGPHVRPRGST